MEFKDLKFKSIMDGLSSQAKQEFANGYGVSVIIGAYTYGGDKGLYELAVTKGGDLCYTTEVASDVIGYLSESNVTELLGQVEAL